MESGNKEGPLKDSPKRCLKYGIRVSDTFKVSDTLIQQRLNLQSSYRYPILAVECLHATRGIHIVASAIEAQNQLP